MRVVFGILLFQFMVMNASAGIYTVTNTNNSGGGSLAQAISNVNGAGAGPHTIQFSIPTASPGYDATRGVFTITLTSLLPVLTRDDVTIDATTQISFTGNTNPGQLGSGGTVGTDSLPLAKVDAPEIEIKDGGNLDRCFEIRANNFTIRGFAIYGFGTDVNSLYHGAIVYGEWSNAYNVALIEKNIIGSFADTILDPGPADLNESHGITVVRVDSVVVQNNIIAYRSAAGMSFYQFTSACQVLGNEVINCGKGNPNYDGIGFGAEASNNLVRGNLVVNAGAVGLECWRTQGNMTFESNTVTGSGYSMLAGQEEAGIRLCGTGNIVRKNIIVDNQGPGVIVFGDDGAVAYTPSNQNIISQNYFSGNEKNAIDLLLTGADLDQGDGITLNDAGPTSCGILATSGNEGLDFPVIDSAKYFSGNGLTGVYGRACPNSIIEIYFSQSGSGDMLSGKNYGEGTIYIDSTKTDGSGFFTKNVSGLDSSNFISTIVIDPNNNTSEFSENLKVLFVLENCNNGIDDDMDGLVDCQDTLDCRPSVPGLITPANATICSGQTGESYSIAAIPGATSYTWSIPLGASITGGQGTTSITVNWGSTAGDVCVYSSTPFCDSSPNCLGIIVTHDPDRPVSIQH